MKGNAKVGGRPVRNDPRSLNNYVGLLDLRATHPIDPFILAAIYRVVFGGEAVAVELRKSLIKEANACAAAHGRAVAAASFRTAAKAAKKPSKKPPSAPKGDESCDGWDG